VSLLAALLRESAPARGFGRSAKTWMG
jgi:hypothetical protein